MSYEIKQYTPEQHICCTSVQDGCLTIMNTSDIGVLRRALAYEKRGRGRATLIKKLKARIKKLEKLIGPE